MQPWLDRRPGMSMGPWGLHYERTQTWWEQSPAWHEYLARCQYLLQQGLFVADICCLEPEGSPQRFMPPLPGRQGNTPDRPRVQFDGCTARGRADAHDGQGRPAGAARRHELPAAGACRAVETMTPRLLRKIKELVEAGATVVGTRPVKSPSLSRLSKRRCGGRAAGRPTLGRQR